MSATVSCPHCNGKIVADPRIAGREVGCPHCNGRVIMPTAQAPKPALPAQPVQQAPSGLTTIDPLDFLDAPSAPNRNAGYSTGYAPPPTTYGSYGSQNKRKTVSPLVWIIPAIIVGLLMIGWVGARQFGGGTITFAESVDSSTLRTTNEGNHFSTGLVPMVIRGNGSFGSSVITVPKRGTSSRNGTLTQNGMYARNQFCSTALEHLISK